ncbi:MAG: serine/threonine protein kinase [Candidatus Brocadiaceae bacterium]|nr:serine/threonine protein kinase [Candidatus Brocadiaceae bacterium]
MAIKISGYKINEILHDGAKTIVCRGCREEDGAPVIIKALKSAYPTRKDLSRLRHEYDVLQDLNIRGIVKPCRLERHENGLALISEDFQGESLQKFLKRNTAGIREFLIIASTLSEIVGEIHQKGIIHKDIKPGNIVINPDTKETRIIDFGLSTRLQREEQRDMNPGSLEGTLAYMSPEQTGRMNRSIDYRTDFYSLGITFYEMLTGDVPFRSDDPMELVHCHIAKMPVSPHEVNKETPGVVSDIVMKLIRKNAEDRYQSAHGLKRDLDKCLRQWEETGVVSGFTIGMHDMSEQFHIPQKLYGREPEVAMLMEGFERVCRGTPEVMLVCGYSGVGKSSLVNEVHKPIVAKRGYFISGKYDQYKRNIPYSGVIQAFRGLIQQLLTESEACLAVWKEALLHALGHNGQVIIDVIPDVEHVTGKQPPVPQLGPQETQNRFNQVFQQFIGVLATERHPLVIFLDDLQWVDLGSLKLLKTVTSHPDCRYVYLVGAYRDNEVDGAHALTLAVDGFGKTGVVINKITLSPLGSGHICQILSDSLHCEGEKVATLSELLSRKTGGNPFFVNQLLTTLHAEGAIAFDFSRNCWQWDTERIEQKGYTDNIVELMAGKIQKFGENTQHALQLAACIGNTFDIRTLSVVHGKSEEETSGDLWDAVKEGLIVPLGDNYYDCKNSNTEYRNSNFGFRASDFISSAPQFKFLHDRVQQAAYSLITDDLKMVVHLTIGRRLLKNGSEVETEENLFDIINHLNTGIELITSQEERNELARLNLRAGRKAKASTAYEDALRHITIGMELLAENSWQDQYELSLSLHNEGAAAACLCGDFPRMETLVARVLKHAKTTLDCVKAYETRIRKINCWRP